VFVPCPTLLLWAIILFFVSRRSHLVNPHTKKTCWGSTLHHLMPLEACTKTLSSRCRPERHGVRRAAWDKSPIQDQRREKFNGTDKRTKGEDLQSELMGITKSMYPFTKCYMGFCTPRRTIIDLKNKKTNGDLLCSLGLTSEGR